MKRPQTTDARTATYAPRGQRGDVGWVLLPLLVLSVCLYFFWRQQQSPVVQPRSQVSLASQSDENRLALGAAAQPGIVDIPIRPPLSLNFMSRDQVLRARINAVVIGPQLTVRPYKPSAEVFSQIVDGAPWWGIEGQFFHGPGQRSIEGPSEEARFLLNPYLLVAPEFGDDWKGKIKESELAGFPLYCPPQNLRWNPREAYAEVSYEAGCIAKRQPQEFDLIAYNARDLNLPYIYVSYAESKNVDKLQPPSVAYANPQFLHKGGSCGYPGGCNNMSPLTPPIGGIRLTGLPASVVIRLWSAPPTSVAQTPDMRFVIRFS